MVHIVLLFILFMGFDLRSCSEDLPQDSVGAVVTIIPDDQKLPIVFSPYYDIGFFGIEKLHPFDSKKYGKVAAHLKQELHLTEEHFYVPDHEVSEDDLKQVHDVRYLASLTYSANVERIAELPGLRFVPNFLLQWKLLSPMRYATQGTIDAAFLALKRGIGINLGGGYHHAKSSHGGGFCFYADIPLAIKKLRELKPDLQVLYLDLDAHQGNGVASYFVDDPNTYIVDCFNEHNYPRDRLAKERVNKVIGAASIYCAEHKNHRRGPGFECTDCKEHYLHAVRKGLDDACDEFKSDIIFYNAGTDCFQEDQIGAMALSEQGIIDRDEMVFQKADALQIPLCMTLSGGYSPKSAAIISASLLNLYAKQLLKAAKE